MKHGNLSHRLPTVVYFVLIAYYLLLSGVEAEAVLGKGAKAPGFRLPSLSGERGELRIPKGEKSTDPEESDIPYTYVLSFWATYCNPCRKEIPELHEFEKEHRGDRVKVFLINLDKNVSKVAPFVKKHEYTLPVLLDPRRRVAERYGVKTLPALFVVGPEGLVQYSSVGYRKNYSLKAGLDSVLAGIRGDPESGRPSGVSPVPESNGDTPQSSPGTDVMNSHDIRWKAVWRVECGESVQEVAAELGVDPNTIMKWTRQLKSASESIWETR